MPSQHYYSSLALPYRVSENSYRICAIQMSIMSVYSINQNGFCSSFDYLVIKLKYIVFYHEQVLNTNCN